MTKSNPRAYFRRLIGKAVTYRLTVPGGGRVTERRYLITPRGLNGNTMASTVQRTDYGKDGMLLSAVPLNLGPVNTSFDGVDDAQVALEDVARAADPASFVAVPKVMQASSEALNAVLERRIAAIMSPEGRPDGIPPPTDGSLQVLRKYWAQHGGHLVPPQLFSSQDGSVRAIWTDGADRTLTLVFSEGGVIRWTVMVPRQGDIGLAKFSGRCHEDRDIQQAARAFGIKCERG